MRTLSRRLGTFLLALPLVAACGPFASDFARTYNGSLKLAFNGNGVSQSDQKTTDMTFKAFEGDGSVDETRIVMDLGGTECQLTFKLETETFKLVPGPCNIKTKATDGSDLTYVLELASGSLTGSSAHVSVSVSGTVDLTVDGTEKKDVPFVLTFEGNEKA